MKYDGGKLRYDLLPPEPIADIVRVLTYGAQKYDDNSWQTVPNGVARYTAALMRHFEAWRAGESVDRESQLHHLAHAACNAVFLLYLVCHAPAPGRP